MKQKNTGKELENEVYDLIVTITNKNEFMVSNPNVRIKRKPRYYSKDREAEIEFDVSVEKYLVDPDENKNIKPSIIIVIECKDYLKGIPVDDVEEFHAKLQQIGADSTKGIVITKNGFFQKSAVSYAESKGIALARIMPDNQITFVLFCMSMQMGRKMTDEEKQKIKEEKNKPLVESGYISCNRNFFSLSGEESLEELVISFFGINYYEYTLLGIEMRYNEIENVKIKKKLRKKRKIWSIIASIFSR